MTPPKTPLTDEQAQAVDYANWLDIRANFMQTYEDTFASIYHSRRIKKGLKTIAYEAVETIYQHYCRKGRKYLDFENFKSALCDHNRQSIKKIKDT